MKRLSLILEHLLRTPKYNLQYLGTGYAYDVDRTHCWCGEQLIPDWGWLDMLKARCPYPPRSFQMKCCKHENTTVTAHFTGGQQAHDMVINHVMFTTQNERRFTFHT